MAKLWRLEINHFRGIESFTHTFKGDDIICLVGRGDSGKTTILDAIAYLLCPSWTKNFEDTDFYSMDFNKDILIRGYFINFPEKLQNLDTYGEFLMRINENGEVCEDMANTIPCLCLELKVSKNLDPEWNVFCERHEEGYLYKSIGCNNRKLFQMYQIADMADLHFAWKRNSPLSNLVYGSKEDNIELLDIIRELRQKIELPENLSKSTNLIQQEITDFGLKIGKVSSQIDVKNFGLDDGDISLHEGNMPLRLLGRGTRRLASIAIQQAFASSEEGILLIDEVEQGLEPDRVKHLLRTLRFKQKGQVFLTTHSASAIEELDAENLFVTDNLSGMVTLKKCKSAQQNILRIFPEAFLAKKIIVCEGKTEVGFCMAMELYGGINFAKDGTVYVFGEGSKMPEYISRISLLLDNGYCAFYDGDNLETSQKLEEIQKELGNKLELFPLNEGECIEQAVLGVLPIEAFPELIQAGCKRIDTTISSFLHSIGLSEEGDITESNRNLIIQGTIDSKLFKNIDGGKFLGKGIYDSMEDPKVKECNIVKNMKKLILWSETSNGT